MAPCLLKSSSSLQSSRQVDEVYGSSSDFGQGVWLRKVMPSLQGIVFLRAEIFSCVRRGARPMTSKAPRDQEFSGQWGFPYLAFFPVVKLLED